MWSGQDAHMRKEQVQKLTVLVEIARNSTNLSSHGRDMSMSTKACNERVHTLVHVLQPLTAHIRLRSFRRCLHDTVLPQFSTVHVQRHGGAGGELSSVAWNAANMSPWGPHGHNRRDEGSKRAQERAVSAGMEFLASLLAVHGGRCLR